ncbi:hypothetical protein Rsub_06901 [Raphidocelis subcapitata]|uniref:Uncharacterized protein n=1 Tax=Raphidocelis subcapitata TaxID=307507 RepID=A0A2V0P4R3_9CHLO|nr:hypothetical protein Rsub_06901 [Raphidocelis subcapitata]|eukprot:GBF93902.1 hypothetical protein Rsub_06901 [Raphidocelis subcapitata]
MAAAAAAALPAQAAAAAVAGGARAFSPADLLQWRASDWAAVHHRAPSLLWAHRLYVVTGNTRPLSLLPRRGDFLEAAKDGARRDADASLAAAAHLAGACRGAAPPACKLVVAVPPEAEAAAAGAALPGALPGGWAVARAPAGGPPEGYAAAVRDAGALLVWSDAPPLYLGLAHPKAALLWLGQDSKARAWATQLCAGRPCLSVASSADVAAALAGLQCK